MRRCCLAISTVALLMVVATVPGISVGQNAATPKPSPPPIPRGPVPEKSSLDTLHWANGDSLFGDLVTAGDNRLTWKTPLFVDPVTIDGRYLRSIDFGITDPASVSHPEPLRIVFRNGDLIYAKLMAVSDGLFTLQSKRHGTVRVKQSSIRLIQRMDNPGLIYQGPRGPQDWVTLEQGHPFEKWKETSEGHLTTTGWLAELFRELPIPGQAEIELAIESRDKPRFLIAFGNRPDDSVRLETWDDELVALAGDDFEPILTISPKQKTVVLRMYWDRESGGLAVYSGTGKKLGSIAQARATDEKAGFYIRNKGTHLSLQTLRVNRWNGAPPRELTGAGSRIHQVSGTAIYGEIKGFDADAGVLTVQGEDKTHKVAMTDVDRVFLADDAGDVDQGGLVQAFYYDGTRLTGDLTRIGDGSLGLQTPHSTETVRSGLNGARQLRFKPKAPPPEDGLDRVLWDGGSLRGTLAGGDQPASAIQWRPVGGINSSPLAAASKARFVRGEKTEGIKYDANTYGDMLFLTTRDVIPCRLLSIDEEFIHLESAFAATRKIPHAYVRAIELASRGEVRVIGFKDPRWKEIGVPGKNIDRTDDKLVFHRPSAMSHPGLFNGDELSFELQWDTRTNATVVLSLNATELNSAPAQPHIAIVCQGENIGVVDPAKMLFGAAAKSGQREKKSGRTAVRLRSRENRIEVFIDGELLFDRPDPSLPKTAQTASKTPQARNSGMIVQADPGRLNDNDFAQLTISELKVRSNAGQRVSKVVDEKVRKRALTIPRFRRESPSTHVLIAPNGDLLRGRLSGLRDDRMQYESLLDLMTFDRSRVSAIVWLHPDGVSEPPGWDKNAPIVRVVLDGNLMIVVNPQKMADGRLVGNSPLLGQCAVPIGSIRELHAGGFGPIDDTRVYANWTPEPAMEPIIPGAAASGDSPQDLTFSPLVGKPAPDFTVELLDGKKKTLSDYKGKVVVLDFWATWCVPCVKALPELIETVEPYKEKGVVLLAVNQEEQPEVVRKFLEAKGLKVTVAMDRNAAIGSGYNVDSLPQTIVINQDGHVAAHAVGYTRDGIKSLQEVIKKLVTGEDAEASESTTEESKPAAATETTTPVEEKG